MNQVQLLYAYAGRYQIDRGSYAATELYEVVVDNIAYYKVVGIWGHEVGAVDWSFYPCSYVRSVTGNKEIWKVSITERGDQQQALDQFVISYEVAGQHYWDNNSGHNYLLDAESVEHSPQLEVVTTAIICPPLLVMPNYGALDPDSWYAFTSYVYLGDLYVSVWVQNIDYHKQVGIVYTTDGWQTWHTAFASYQCSYSPGPLPGQTQVEKWSIQTPIGVSQPVEYAVFYNVRNNTYWDNNFGRNYVAEVSDPTTFATVSPGEAVTSEESKETLR